MSANEPAAYALFDTAIGACGLAWRGDLVTAVALPHRERRATTAQLRRYGAGAEATPPSPIADILARVVDLLAGRAVSFDDAALDDACLAPFERSVYAVTRNIPLGATRTYGEIAAELGGTGDARAVGQALGRNPFPIIVPCHRVLAAGGKAGGFSAPGGLATKRRLLAIESVHAREPTLFDAARACLNKRTPPHAN